MDKGLKLDAPHILSDVLEQVGSSLKPSDGVVNLCLQLPCPGNIRVGTEARAPGKQT